MENARVRFKLSSVHLQWFGGEAPPLYEGSRIANATRTWQADEDLDVIDWTVGDDFCFSVGFGCQSGKKVSSRVLQLRWRNVTDSGSFAALSGSGELTWSGTTDLVNDDALTEVESGIAASQATYDTADAKEREGANDTAAITLAEGEWTAYMWAIDTANALAGKKYEFELYNVTDGAAIATCLADITMYAAPSAEDLATKYIRTNGLEPLKISGG